MYLTGSWSVRRKPIGGVDQRVKKILCYFLVGNTGKDT
jgi:hypothetical protein